MSIIREYNICFNDTETSGLSYTKNSLLEICAVITTPPPEFKVISTFQTVIKPAKDKEIVQEAMDVNLLDPEWLMDHAPNIVQVAYAFDAFMKMSTTPLDFGGFNCPFDIGFTTAMLSTIGAKPNWQSLTYDLLYKSKIQLPNLPKHKLEFVCAELGVKNLRAHTALGDVMATIKVARKLHKMETEKDRLKMLSRS
jgi:DNA polymerase III alpha subunit (gram-positive type)